MTTLQKTSSQPSSDEGEGIFGHLFSPHKRPSTGSSTETVLHHPQSQKENLPPTPGATSHRTNTKEPHLPRIHVGCPSGIPQLLGFHTRRPSPTDFSPSVTQEANWQLPHDLGDVLKYQAKHYAPRKPKEKNFALQAQTQNRIFDPELGPIYSHCTECDPNGGPTDCQHPEDPKAYSTELNPIPEGDPAFKRGRFPEPLPSTPRKANPGIRLITNPSLSGTVLTTQGELRLTFTRPNGFGESVKHLNRFSQVKIDIDKHIQHPDEMLAARHLSKFLTDNVVEGVATSYIIFSTHGTLLGYSSPVPVKTARNIAALAGITWRVNNRALLRGDEIPSLTGGASFLKTIAVTEAENASGLDNMICVYKDLLMAVQWVKDSFLAAALIEADQPQTVSNDMPSSKSKDARGFEIGASASDTDHDQDDEVWEDEEAVEETTEDEEDKAKAQEQAKSREQIRAQERAKEPSKQTKLFEKSRGLASAVRDQWKVDGFKMPPGFR
ncbi:MAG: hypothetical protein Q9219_000944 [cf. Caloplaca sp. 3 TL-2023]